MQTVSPQFEARAAGKVRPIRHELFISFLKNYEPTATFFTIGDSSIGGSDAIKGVASVIQEWDKYIYDSFSDRVLQIEWDRGTEPPINSMTMATADIVLDNHDDLFTPGNTASPLYGYLVARRPVRIHVGFGNETIQVFVGITEGRPEINERAKTATFHCIDFLKAIADIPLDEELMFVDYRTDEIVSELLQTGGLSTSQFNLDVGTVIIPFAYFKKGSKLGDALRDIAQAELGNISMDENGISRFQNRTNWADNVSVLTITKEETHERKDVSGKIINVTEVYSKARAVEAKQKLWESDPQGVVQFDDKTDFIGPGETKTITIDFKDEYGELPVTTADDPDYISGATTSLYSTNELRDGTGETFAADIDLTNSYLFSTAMQLEFTNSGSNSVYIKQLEIHGTPAKVQSDIYERVASAASVGTLDGYEEHVYKIENNYIQDAIAARSIATIINEDMDEDDDQQELLIKAFPQLQIGDMITYDDETQTGDYFITGINGILNKTSGFRQSLRISKRVINSYFATGTSAIGGSDQIAP